MSHVNQGSINAKGTAGLTYQTQLLMLNTGPSSQWAKNNRILMRHCVGGYAEPELSWCENQWVPECVCARGTHVCVSRISKGFSQTVLAGDLMHG